METHTSHYNNYTPEFQHSSSRYQNQHKDSKTLDFSNEGNNFKNSEHDVNTKYDYYWGRLRKGAVKTTPCVLRPNILHQTNENSPSHGNYCRWYKYNGAIKKIKDSEKCVIDVVNERKKALKFFREQYKLIKKQGAGKCSVRIDLQAWEKVKESGLLLIEDKFIGPVPGVEVEDSFEFRVELVIMGIHSQLLHGIDYKEMPKGGVIATSIVATEGYYDLMVNPDEVIYTGEWGNFGGSGKKGKNQELKCGNLALKNSINEGNYVRVVRGIKARDSRTIFVYDGLYKVVSFYKELGVLGNLQFKFILNRCVGQKTIVWSKYKK